MVIAEIKCNKMRTQKRLKGWLAVAKLKPLSLFIPLFEHCQMLSYCIDYRKMKSESGFSLAMQWLASPLLSWI